MTELNLAQTTDLPAPVTQIANLPYRRLAACSCVPLLFLIGALSLFETCRLHASALEASLPSFPSRPSVRQNSAFRVPPSASFPSRPSVENSAFRVPRSAFLAQLSTPSATTFGAWLACAVAALSILALGKQFMRKTPIEAEFLTKKEFNEFRDKVDTSFNSLRDRIDHSHETLATKLDAINTRLHEVTSLVARLDERTNHVSRITHQEGGNPS